MKQAHWEITLEDADLTKHIWIVYREHISMFIVAGFPEYEAITPDTGCFVMVDSANRKIKEVMSKGWQPVTKEDALKHMAQGAGRTYKRTA